MKTVSDKMAQPVWIRPVPCPLPPTPPNHTMVAGQERDQREMKSVSDKMAQRVWIRPVPCPLSP